MRKIITFLFVITMVFASVKLPVSASATNEFTKESRKIDISGNNSIDVGDSTYWRLTASNGTGVAHNHLSIEFTSMSGKYKVVVTADNQSFYESGERNSVSFSVDLDIEEDVVYRVYLINTGSTQLGYTYHINTFYN